MTTLEKLKNSLLKARKAKEYTGFLSFVIAECEKVGKSKANRESTEEEVQAVLKKLIANNEILINQKPMTCTTSVQMALTENDFLQSLRPEMVSEDELKAFIAGVAGPLGNIMGAVKKEFGPRADMKMASELARATL